MITKDVVSPSRLRAYIYPNSKRIDQYRRNPYIPNFVNALSRTFDFLNWRRPTQLGILDIVPYLRQIDFAFFHWIEDLPDRSYGGLQTCASLLLLRLLKARKVRIFYTLHNRCSHSKSRLGMKRTLLRGFVRNSDFLLTHAADGISLLRSDFPGLEINARVLPHPVEGRLNVVNSPSPTHDLLIWGSLLPYKGIEAFLLHVRENVTFRRLRIKIVGLASSEHYFNRLSSLVGSNVELEHRRASLDEIRLLAGCSRATLFPYAQESVLSSGSLMDAVSMGARIIGPRTGAFADLERQKLVLTYGSYDEIPGLLEHLDDIDEEGLRRFVEENSWQRFGSRIEKWVDESYRIDPGC